MKKILFIYLFLILLLPKTASAVTTLKNCSMEIIPDGQTSSGTCFSTGGKIAADDVNCGVSMPAVNQVCCCNAAISYDCHWQGSPRGLYIGYSSDWSDQAPECKASEIKGTDCSPLKPDNQMISGKSTPPICCCPGTATGYTKAKFTMPVPEIIDINALNLSTATCTGPENSGTCAIPWIAQLIQYLYTFGLGVGGILAAVVLMAGGLVWLVSAGDATKITQAKSLMVGSITGLMILFGSYILLTQINPNLVVLKPLSLKMIDKIVIEAGNETPIGADTPFFACVHKTFGTSAAEVEAKLTSVKFLDKDYKVNTQTAAALKKAQTEIDLLSLDYKSTESSGGGYNWRANANDPTQQSLHSFGLAIDINPSTNPNYTSSKRPCQTNIPAGIIQALKNNGFRWGGDFKSVCDSMHFEYVKGDAPCVIKN